MGMIQVSPRGDQGVKVYTDQVVRHLWLIIFLGVAHILMGVVSSGS